uniref:Phospholipase D-like domain-containing protein n=1 Tax=viral metagenome TaxID=1070528 RepID=A0A6C0BZR9_9ZZZZ
MNAGVADDRASSMLKHFEQGIWAQHLKDQKNSQASVQGVRFFYADSSPSDGFQLAECSSEWPAAAMSGATGYICVTPKTARVNADGTLKVSLDGLKDMLVKRKAWESNRKAYVKLQNMKVPVVFMSVGRPPDRKFGARDGLLGLFLCSHMDPDILSCKLTSCDSGCGTFPALPTEDLQKFFDMCTQPGRKRRRELLVCYTTGCLMGAVDRLALTGAHCKDLYIQSLQRAKHSIRLNAYCISDQDIIEELRFATERGVAVKLRYDHRQQTRTNASCFEEERLRLVQVHPIVVSEDEKLIMHKKELLVDADEEGAFVVLGSYNPTITARGSQESVVRLEDPYLVESLRKRFEWDWAQEEASKRQRNVDMQL